VQAKIKAKNSDSIKLTNIAKSPTQFINHAIDPLNKDNNRPPWFLTSQVLVVPIASHPQINKYGDKPKIIVNIESTNPT